MRRFAQNSRVFFFEEPLFRGDAARLLTFTCAQTGVRIITPELPESLENGPVADHLRPLLQQFIEREEIENFVAWYYTPMALDFTSELAPALTVYDCMDELSAFSNAPANMLANERKLFERADLIFTGGASLYESKRSRHEHVHLFPSSVDVAHFSRALSIDQEPEDQRAIPHPRIGYAGVIDERMDLKLIEYLADVDPDWHIVLVGPVVKIDSTSMPQRPNIHLLGMKNYGDLPAYFSGWDVALLPFALNDATRFISPTKTPEYLAAGLPVVSTAIRDVEHPYGSSGLVQIGRTPEQFARAIEQQLCDGRSPTWQAQVHEFLSSLSWDTTWRSMERLMAHELARKKRVEKSATAAPRAILKPEVSGARV